MLSERALGQSGRPYGHRRLQIGHDAQAGKDLVGSYGRCYVPYDKVKYRTRYVVPPEGRTMRGE